uniref:TIMP metallopeptidase inhibitor 4 n=1 Tax=Cynoglossus semilaevis TaxID=244447 RepID=A0A3P8X651_CYNSE
TLAAPPSRYSLWVLVLLGAALEAAVEGCSCHPAHPQQLFCTAEIVIRAKISGEKIVSPSNSSSPYMKMIQYEIKMIKVRTVDLLLLFIGVLKYWSIVTKEKSNLEEETFPESSILSSCPVQGGVRGQSSTLLLCPQINTCYTVPCASTGDNECLWTDWLLDNSLNGEQARQYACIRRFDTTCSWYRGGPPPEKDFLDITDP